MSKTYKEVTVEARTEKRVDYVCCDLCGAKGLSDPFGSDWAKKQYEVATTNISYEVGDRYPECGGTIIHSVDLCPTCFMERLVPWLESQGAIIQKKEENY